MRRSLGALCALVLLSPPALGHHSLAAYDDSQVQSITGQVAAFEWINPHIRIHIRDENAAEAEPLLFEGGDIGRLTRLGWRADAFREGDTVTVSYNPFSAGGPGGHFLEITAADGEIYSLIRFRRAQTPAVSAAQ